MTRFIQLHALTIYAPSNLNRDDSGRPKSAKFGGAERLRISSQALKRAIRTSDAFKKNLDGHLGTRSARNGDWFKTGLKNAGLSDASSMAIARTMSVLVGTIDAEKSTEETILNKELFFMAPQERAAFESMFAEIARNPELERELAEAAGAVDDEDADADGEEEATSKKKKGKSKGLSKKRLTELRGKVFVTVDKAADIAMFGRMIAAEAKFNREAAVQVAHAITTHKVEIEDDFYTAVDDLKKSSEDAGAGFIGELGFGSGVFYLYACIDRDLLEKNLGGDKALANTALMAFIEGLTTASPSGKQNSFASRARASYVRVEKGSQQPRNLAAAFFKPVTGDDLLRRSIELIEHPTKGIAKQMNDAYGACFDKAETMQFIPGDEHNHGSLERLIAFALEA